MQCTRGRGRSVEVRGARRVVSACGVCDDRATPHRAARRAMIVAGTGQTTAFVVMRAAAGVAVRRAARHAR